MATIGFTQTSAKGFFDRLKHQGVRRLIDVRLNNTSQLSGFAKATDLPYFLHELVGADYVHMPILAPTEIILRQYKAQKGPWQTYEQQFLSLMSIRRIEDALSPADLTDACLLCSESKPHHCHRRLVVEYLQRAWGLSTLAVKHL